MPSNARMSVRNGSILCHPTWLPHFGAGINLFRWFIRFFFLMFESLAVGRSSRERENVRMILIALENFTVSGVTQERWMREIQQKIYRYPKSFTARLTLFYQWESVISPYICYNAKAISNRPIISIILLVIIFKLICNFLIQRKAGLEEMKRNYPSIQSIGDDWVS